MPMVKKGLTGEQGVFIPRSNVIHLMLREEVMEGVAPPVERMVVAAAPEQKK